MESTREGSLFAMLTAVEDASPVQAVEAVTRELGAALFQHHLPGAAAIGDLSEDVLQPRAGVHVDLAAHLHDGAGSAGPSRQLQIHDRLR